MSLASQNRPPLADAVQKAAANSLASLVALQIANFDAAGSLDRETDLALCDASGGAFDLALPTSLQAVAGKPIVVRETEGTNAVTLTTPGSETIDGSATFVVAAGTSACVVWDGTTWHSIANAGSGGSGFLADGAGTVDATNLAANSVTPPKIDLVQTDVAQDGALELTRAMHGTLITLDSTTGAKAITTNADVENGEVIHFYMTARSGGSYTLALGGSQTLTFDAADERASIQRVAGAWRHLSLVGATVA